MDRPAGFELDETLWMRRRVIGEITSGEPGPLLLCFAGVHGNEPSGGHALMRILDELAHRIPLRRGGLLALTGNRPALEKGLRYVEEDLNRCWTDERIARLRSDPDRPRSVEEREMLELLDVVEPAMDEAEDIHVLDFHSTSGPGLPFGCSLDADRDPALFASFALPIVVGVEAQMRGTIMDWFQRRGHSAIGVEGGQHDDPTTIDAHEAVLRLALDALGMRGFDADPRLEEARRLLEDQAAGLPRVLELVRRFEVRAGSDFEMMPGFRNFDRVKKGQMLARDSSGPILAEEDAWLLFPRYQSQGDDGFFLARAL